MECFQSHNHNKIFLGKMELPQMCASVSMHACTDLHVFIINYVCVQIFHGVWHNCVCISVI